MKKIYFSAQMTIVALCNHDIIVTSGFGLNGTKSDVATLSDDFEENGYIISW